MYLLFDRKYFFIILIVYFLHLSFRGLLFRCTPYKYSATH